MHISSISVSGLRGFATTQTLQLGVPNGQRGSGLTVLVGPNNSGKSTLIEAFRACSAQTPQSITEGRRNKSAGDRVSLQIEVNSENKYTLRTVVGGGSEMEWSPNRPDLRILTLPSRRYFDPFFSKSAYVRETYASNMATGSARGGILREFAYRLFTIQTNRSSFDNVLKHILNPVPDWVIDQSDGGQHYLNFKSGTHFHSSEGMGEGLVSVFVIVDALYDSSAGDLIVIDEPELSLHPTLQRRVSELLAEYTKTRQIVIARAGFKTIPQQLSTGKAFA